MVKIAAAAACNILILIAHNLNHHYPSMDSDDISTNIIDQHERSSSTRHSKAAVTVGASEIQQ